MKRKQTLIDRQSKMRQRMTIEQSQCEDIKMAITDPAQIGEIPCMCGRIARKPHCPNCGSYDVYGRSSKHDTFKVDIADGTKRRVSTFQCKRCRMYFDRDQWEMDCRAPQYTTKAIQKRISEELNKPVVELQIQHTLSRDETLIAVNKLRAQRGMEPLASLDQKEQ